MQPTARRPLAVLPSGKWQWRERRDHTARQEAESSSRPPETHSPSECHLYRDQHHSASLRTQNCPLGKDKHCPRAASGPGQSTGHTAPSGLVVDWIALLGSGPVLAHQPLLLSWLLGNKTADQMLTWSEARCLAWSAGSTLWTPRSQVLWSQEGQH